LPLCFAGALRFNPVMHVRFLLGPAGSGKTFRCLREIRAALTASPLGPPLVLLAPKQATFQLERQLLADASLAGYTRLRILSFERLAGFAFEQLRKPLPRLLAEEGRVMVLRALLAQKHAELRLFRASSRLPGFARRLSDLLREFQRHHLTPARLEKLLPQIEEQTPLGQKLHDLALLQCAYAGWLKSQKLHDADTLLSLAADELQGLARARPAKPVLRIDALWMDGFAQMTPQERRLLGALLPFCQRATLAFCLEGEPPPDLSWHSPWSLIGQTYRQVRAEIAAVVGSEPDVEVLTRDGTHSRFAGRPVLRHLERYWAQPVPLPCSCDRKVAGANVSDHALTDDSPRPHGRSYDKTGETPALLSSFRVIVCPNPEAEARFAAREILRFVRDERGRFRDVAVLVRQLEPYHEPIRHVFSRYGVPFFLDRREAITHHPLAELTRFALRTIAFGWKRPDWFGALKTGLVHRDDRAIDELENEALARGWEGKTWKEPVHIADNEGLSRRLDDLRQNLVRPFLKLESALQPHPGAPTIGPTGRQLADGLTEFWTALDVEGRLADWSTRTLSNAHFEIPSALHTTAWEQMQEWRDNLALAFAAEAQPLSAWLPIVEAGLSGLTVGIIPPALDQVLVGALDRSRNPDLQRVFVLGLNETVFPAPPPRPPLLTERERALLAQHGHALGPDPRVQLGHERFYGYIACTRARQRLLLTCAQRDAEGKPLNPSIFVAHLQHLFPSLKVETFATQLALADAQDASELVAPLVQAQQETTSVGIESDQRLLKLAAMPAFASVLQKAAELAAASAAAEVSSQETEKLYGPELQVSVSALEDFAECPFKFFIRRGLRAEERLEFEIDAKEKGSFQHEVLKEFHGQLQAQGKRWRDLEPGEARERIRRLGEEQLPRFRSGLFAASAEREFTGRQLIEGLEKLMQTLVRWNRDQYGFDPHAVEIDFGLGERGLPGWRLDLDEGRALVLRGRIDRVDLCPTGQPGEALGVVIDYKSSERRIDPVKLYHGLELQLLAYLGVLRHLADPQQALGVTRLRPAGVFYVSLRGRPPSGKTRREVLSGATAVRPNPYQHLGRFDRNFLKQFDRRDMDKGDQFKFAVNQDGQFAKRGNEAMPAQEFAQLLEAVEAHLRRIGREIFAGRVQAEPYRINAEKACDRCDYRAVCRFDPWVEPYRVLRPPPKATPNEAPARKARPPLGRVEVQESATSGKPEA
jgi:ATP-dependent helicase/nuclease subunit B